MGPSKELRTTMASSYSGPVTAMQVGLDPISNLRFRVSSPLFSRWRIVIFGLIEILPGVLFQVGSYFVGQYYQVLKEHPDLAHQFYMESSSMVRVDGDSNEPASSMLVLLLYC